MRPADPAARRPGLLGWLPGRPWGIAYLWGIVAVLALVGAAFLANVFVPFTQGAMGRVVLTGALLLASWGAAIVVPGLGRVPSLRPAAAICLPGVPACVLLLLAALWEVGPEERLARLGFATMLAMAFGFLLAPGWHVLGKGHDRAPAAAGTVGVAAAGVALVLAVAGAALPDALVQSAWRFALGLVFASLLLLATARLRRGTRWLAWGAFAQYALLAAADPWAADDLARRMNVAAFALLLVLTLLALTVAFIPRKAWVQV